MLVDIVSCLAALLICTINNDPDKFSPSLAMWSSSIQTYITEQQWSPSSYGLKTSFTKFAKVQASSRPIHLQSVTLPDNLDHDDELAVKSRNPGGLALVFNVQRILMPQHRHFLVENLHLLGSELVFSFCEFGESLERQKRDGVDAVFRLELSSDVFSSDANLLRAAA